VLLIVICVSRLGCVRTRTARTTASVRPAMQSNLALPAAQVHSLTDPAVKPGSTSCTGTPTHRPSSQTWLHHLHRYTHSQTQQSNLTLPAAQVHSLTDPAVKPGSTSCTGTHTHRPSSQTWLHHLHRYTHSQTQQSNLTLPAAQVDTHTLTDSAVKPGSTSCTGTHTNPASCHCHPNTPSSLASLKSRLVLAFWHRISQVVLKKKPLNGYSSSSSNGDNT